MFHKILFTALLATAVFVSDSCAQDDEPVVSEAVEMTVIGSDDGAAPMIFSTRSSGDGAGSIFRMGGGTMSLLGGSGTMPAPDPFSMISNPSVQKDLELVGDQLDRLRDLQKRQQEEMRKHIGSFKNGSFQLGNVKDIGETLRKMKETHQSELKDLLLPHQIDRLRQVALQTHMNRSGTANALASKKVAEALGINKEQAEKMKKKAKELKKKLEEDIAKLKNKMKEELLSELSSEQRKKLKAMTGDKYEAKDEDWKEFARDRVKRFRSRRKPSDSKKD